MCLPRTLSLWFFLNCVSHAVQKWQNMYSMEWYNDDGKSISFWKRESAYVYRIHHSIFARRNKSFAINNLWAKTICSHTHTIYVCSYNAIFLLIWKAMLLAVHYTHNMNALYITRNPENTIPSFRKLNKWSAEQNKDEKKKKRERRI